MRATKNILMILLSGSILLFIIGNLDVYSQTTNNNTFSDSVECFVIPCNENSNNLLASNVTSSTTDQNTTTALIGISFNNITLQDIQDNKEKLKSSLSTYINLTIDKLASGTALTYTYVLPSDVFGKECTNEKCIVGIIVPKKWTDRIMTDPFD